MLQLYQYEVISMTKHIKPQLLREQVRIMERKLGVLADSEMCCCGMTMAQCHALVEIGRAVNISLIDLSVLLNLDNSTMSRTVNNLVNKGMAERALDPNDRRYVTIRLTENGQRAFEEIEANMNLYFERIFQSIPADKHDQILESMQLLLNAFPEIACC